MGDFQGHPFRGNQYTTDQVTEAAQSARQNVIDTLGESGFKPDTEEYNRLEGELMPPNLAMAADQSGIPEDTLREHLGWPSRAEEARWKKDEADAKANQAKMDRKEAMLASHTGLAHDGTLAKTRGKR
jgi:hypothetical protein